MPAPRSESARTGAPAKVNLFLHVLAREESGYHALETLFCAISLADEIRVERGAAGVRLHVQGEVDTGPEDQNLVVRAARAFYDRLGEPAAVDLHLAKHIPAAAGLGGGSSDAAATLRVLNHLHGGPLSPDALLLLGSGLGSDIPFFLCGSTLALGTGRGERLLPLRPLPSRPVLVCHPGAGMPTAAAYRRLDEARGDDVPAPRLVPPEQLRDWESVAALARNDFTEPVLSALPGLGDALAVLRDAGASPALLAGSGSAIFGVFRTAAERDAAMQNAQGLGLRCWAAETLEREPALSG